MKPKIMTIGELKAKIADCNDNAEIVICPHGQINNDMMIGLDIDNYSEDEVAFNIFKAR